MTTVLPCILLAAGASRRMGRPKLLIEVAGQPILSRVLRAAHEGGCSPLICVVGRHTAWRPELSPVPVLRVDNPAPDSDMMDSLRLGVAALPLDCPAFFVLPADHPHIRPADFRALRRQMPTENGAWAVSPSHDGRAGHPLLLAGGLRERILDPRGQETLRDILNHLQRHFVPRPHDGILRDLDTPADLARSEP